MTPLPLPPGYELAFDCGYTWWQTPDGHWSKDGVETCLEAVQQCWAHYVGRRAFRS